MSQNHTDIFTDSYVFLRVLCVLRGAKMKTRKNERKSEKGRNHKGFSLFCLVRSARLERAAFRVGGT